MKLRFYCTSINKVRYFQCLLIFNTHGRDIARQGDVDINDMYNSCLLSPKGWEKMRVYSPQVSPVCLCNTPISCSSSKGCTSSASKNLKGINHNRKPSQLLITNILWSGQTSDPLCTYFVHTYSNSLSAFRRYFQFIEFLKYFRS